MMNRAYFKNLTIAGVTLVITTYVALAASEVIVAQPPHPDLWSALADKVPGLLTLVFLVMVFFRHLDKKNAAYSSTIQALVTTFNENSVRHEAALREVATVLDKVRDGVARIEKK